MCSYSLNHLLQINAKDGHLPVLLKTSHVHSSIYRVCAQVYSLYLVVCSSAYRSGLTLETNGYGPRGCLVTRAALGLGRFCTAATAQWE